jgi:hypothetical protein
MNNGLAAAGRRPLSDPARDRFMSAVTVNVVTRLGARLAITDAAERTVRSAGAARA